MSEPILVALTLVELMTVLEREYEKHRESQFRNDVLSSLSEIKLELKRMKMDFDSMLDGEIQALSENVTDIQLITSDLDRNRMLYDCSVVAKNLALKLIKLKKPVETIMTVYLHGYIAAFMAEPGEYANTFLKGMKSVYREYIVLIENTLASANKSIFRTDHLSWMLGTIPIVNFYSIGKAMFREIPENVSSIDHRFLPQDNKFYDGPTLIETEFKGKALEATLASWNIMESFRRIIFHLDCGYGNQERTQLALVELGGVEPSSALGLSKGFRDMIFNAVAPHVGFTDRIEHTSFESDEEEATFKRSVSDAVKKCVHDFGFDIDHYEARVLWSRVFGWNIHMKERSTRDEGKCLPSEDRIISRLVRYASFDWWCDN